MGQPRSQMIAGAVQENLRLIFEPAKCARMNDAGAVALKLGPVGVALLPILSSARVAGLLRERREGGALGCFHLFAGLPTVLHLAVNPLMSILSVALPRQSLGEGGPRPIFRATRAPLAALAIAGPADRRARSEERRVGKESRAAWSG